MSVNAVVTGIANTSAAGENLTVNFTVAFSNTNLDPAVVEPAVVSVSFSASTLTSMPAINEAVTDALVDYAANELSWTLPRNRCLQLPFVRGLII
jgi:hypothetical protein